jgi:hypothetical protein
VKRLKRQGVFAHTSCHMSCVASRQKSPDVLRRAARALDATFAFAGGEEAWALALEEAENEI